MELLYQFMTINGVALITMEIVNVLSGSLAYFRRTVKHSGLSESSHKIKNMDTLSRVKYPHRSYSLNIEFVV